METTTTSFIDKAIEGLRNAATELDEFQDQLTNGEVTEKYEAVKKKFHQMILDAKNNLKDNKTDTSVLNDKFTEVLEYLKLGETVTKEAFVVQKQQILKAIDEIEVALKETDTDSHFYFKLNTEIEKFKIKMEIIRLQFELGKLGAKKEFASMRDEFKAKVDRIKTKFIEEENLIEQHWHQFRTEVGEAYAHLKKEFVS